jgi:hypothetical protein
MCRQYIVINDFQKKTKAPLYVDLRPLSEVRECLELLIERSELDDRALDMAVKQKAKQVKKKKIELFNKFVDLGWLSPRQRE